MGPLEIVLIIGVLLILFGGKLIPKIGKNLGETIREVRKISKRGLDDESDQPDKSDTSLPK